ncbi:MAG TPA: DegT/DnrJ/EryC1/StrS family aminotransferase [Treponemataceae bacterium]|nr:DegT/DnrJ/EryC1/StrS family aminotransferase [Treponemataceae bacterium]
MAIKTFSSTIRRREMDAVLTCMVREEIGTGDLALRLTQLVKQKFSVAGAVALRSPAIALTYALELLNLENNTGVILSALAPSWQYQSIVSAGYTPMPVDVCPDSGLLDVNLVKKSIAEKGRVLLLNECLGQIPDFAAFQELHIPIIEDISQNAGAIVDENPVGSFGVFSILGLEERDIITAGGGAVLMAPEKRDWSVLKQKIDEAPITDFLPDINSALAWVQLKEHKKNEEIRKEMNDMYLGSLMQGKHSTFKTQVENASPVVYSFPVILNSGYSDVKKYALKKDIEIVLAFQDSIATVFADQCKHCTQALSLRLRCVLFPLYPRLGSKKAQKIAKVLATLP